MKIYLFWEQKDPLFPLLVDFLVVRGHEIVNKQELLKPTDKMSLETQFETSLCKLKKADFCLFNFQNFDFRAGFLLAQALAKYQTRCVVFYDSKAMVPDFLKGCTFKNLFLKLVNNFSEIRNYLAFLKL